MIPNKILRKNIKEVVTDKNKKEELKVIKEDEIPKTPQ